MQNSTAKQKTNILHDVGKTLKVWRVEKDMTQSDVAVQIGISPQQYQKYEKGNSSIELSRMFEICSVFGKSPSELIQNGETTKRPSNYNEKAPKSLNVDDVAGDEALVSQADLSFQISELVSAFMSIKSNQDKALIMQMIKRLSSPSN